MQGIFQKENTDKSLKYGIYRHLPTYEKIIRNLVSFSSKKSFIIIFFLGEFFTAPFLSYCLINHFFTDNLSAHPIENLHVIPDIHRLNIPLQHIYVRFKIHSNRYEKSSIL